MERRDAGQKLIAILHRTKMWLNAPMVARQRVGLGNVKDVHRSKTLPTKPGMASIVLHAAWLAIFLGLAIEIVLLAVSAEFGHIPKLNPLIADVAQRIAWSTIVCASISVAMATSKLPVSFKGFAGLLSASLAFKIARAVQKGVGAALSVPPAVVNGPSPLVLGIIKGVEYGLLAAVIAWLAKRKERGPIAHASIGLTMGVFFGAIVLAYTYWSNFKLFSMADAVSRGLNEILFPVDCSLVLFAAEVWSKQWKAAGEHEVRQTVGDGVESML